jgi:hypothetical protein
VCFATIFDLWGPNIFTIVNLKQGFNHIMFVAKDCKKIAFHGNNKLWEWLVMPFGLKNALAFLASHGPGFRRGKFPEMLHR